MEIRECFKADLSYPQAHFDKAQKDNFFISRFFHYCLGKIESMPVLGLVAVSIEKICYFVFLMISKIFGPLNALSQKAVEERLQSAIDVLSDVENTSSKTDDFKPITDLNNPGLGLPLLDQMAFFKTEFNKGLQQSIIAFHQSIQSTFNQNNCEIIAGIRLTTGLDNGLRSEVSLVSFLKRDQFEVHLKGIIYQPEGSAYKNILVAPIEFDKEKINEFTQLPIMRASENLQTIFKHILSQLLQQKVLFFGNKSAFSQLDVFQIMNIRVEEDKTLADGEACGIKVSNGGDKVQTSSRSFSGVRILTVKEIYGVVQGPDQTPRFAIDWNL